MEALQKELTALEDKKKELLQKIEDEKPVLKKELKAMLATNLDPKPIPEHFTMYLASGLGMTTIEPFPSTSDTFASETAKKIETRWRSDPLPSGIRAQ